MSEKVGSIIMFSFFLLVGAALMIPTEQDRIERTVNEEVQSIVFGKYELHYLKIAKDQYSDDCRFIRKHFKTEIIHEILSFHVLKDTTELSTLARLVDYKIITLNKVMFEYQNLHSPSEEKDNELKNISKYPNYLPVYYKLKNKNKDKMVLFLVLNAIQETADFCSKTILGLEEDVQEIKSYGRIAD